MLGEFAGIGRIFNVHPMFRANLAMVRQFNVRCELDELVHGIPMDTLLGKYPTRPVYVYSDGRVSGHGPGRAVGIDASGDAVDTKEGAAAAPGADDGTAALAAVGDGAGDVAEAEAEPSKKKRKRNVPESEEVRNEFRMDARRRPLNALLHLRTHGADSLVMVLDCHPLPLLLQTIRYLKPGAPFALFSRFLEPLSECFRQLKHYGIAVRMTLVEAWTRKYQVRADRHCECGSAAVITHHSLLRPVCVPDAAGSQPSRHECQCEPWVCPVGSHGAAPAYGSDVARLARAAGVCGGAGAIHAESR